MSVSIAYSRTQTYQTLLISLSFDLSAQPNRAHDHLHRQTIYFIGYFNYKFENVKEKDERRRSRRCTDETDIIPAWEIVVTN